MTRWISILVPLGVAGFAGWLGYQNEVAAVTAAGKAPITFRSTVRRLMTDREQRKTLAGLEELRQRAGRNALTPSEAAACWQVIRGFTEEQVKAYLAELPKDERAANRQLTEMLIFRWGQLAPEAAAREVVQNPAYARHRMYECVLAAWLPRDRDRAMRWVKEHGSDVMKFAAERQIVRLLVAENPETAPEEAAKLGRVALRTALSDLASIMGGTAEGRKAFVERYARLSQSKEWDQAIDQLAFTAADRDPQGLLDGLEEMGLTPEQQKRFRDRSTMLQMHLKPQEVLEAGMADPGTTEKQRISTYSNWLAMQPNDALAWAVENGRTDFISETVMKSALELLQTPWQPGDTSYWMNSVLMGYAAWHGKEPTAAEAWLSGMPADLRGELEKGGKR